MLHAEKEVVGARGGGGGGGGERLPNPDCYQTYRITSYYGDTFK